MAEDSYSRASKIISQYKSEWHIPDYEGSQSNRIPKTALIGNGDVGAFSKSDYGKISFGFSKSNFWEYNGSPLSIGTLTIEILNEQATNFYECQDILNAKVITETGDARAESFVAAEKNIFITKLSSRKSLRMRLNIEAYKSEGRICKSSLNDDKISVTKCSEFHGSNTVSAVIACEVIGTECENQFCENGNASLEFDLLEGSEVCIAAAVFSSKATEADPYGAAIFMLDKIKTLSNTDAIEKSHNSFWKNYWCTSFIDLDTEDERISDIQKYYYTAQYLLGSGINENACAPGLYGIWHSSDSSPWRSDYHLNYNFISSFYGCASSNRVYQLMPACIAINDYISTGKHNAGDIEQIRQFEETFVSELISQGKITEKSGLRDTVLYPVGIAPYGTSDPKYWNETMNAAYSAWPMIEYYNYTRSESFRRQILYPFLKLVLGILDSWLVEDENGYILYAGYNESSWSKNPAVELAVYKMCLREAISAAKDNKVDEPLIIKWQKYLDGLAPQPVGTYNNKKIFSLAEEEYEDGRFSPLEECIPEDGNAIPLDCIIPGGVSGLFSPPVTVEILKNTVEIFDKNNAWHNCNNFPRLFAYAVNSGYDIEKIVSAFSNVIREQIQPNNTIDDEVHGFEKLGAVRAVNDMLLISDKGIICLFPNWCKNLNASFENLRAKGAFVVSASYNGKTRKIEKATVKSEKGGTVSIALRENEPLHITDSNGKPVVHTFGVLPDRADVKYVSFETVRGMTYNLI